ncbi:MAG TPA: histidine phosphatase family protein [Candidatus Binataceae bacterium]|nr:histidine phosphatase family protein [Candidatus Binataceae bacterium]
MGKLIMVRHGESEGNAIRHFTSSPDAAITAIGRRQAHDAALKIKQMFKPALVIASPYFRARETGRIIAEELGLKLELESEFREQSLGRLAGQPYEVVRGDPTYDPARSWSWRPPGGESHEDVRKRSGPMLDRLARQYALDELVIVSHGGVMRALWAHVTGQWEGAHIPANCGIVLVEHESGRYNQPQIIGGGLDADARQSGG